MNNKDAMLTLRVWLCPFGIIKEFRQSWRCDSTYPTGCTELWTHNKSCKNIGIHIILVNVSTLI